MSKKKIYISLPITGQPIVEARRKAQAIKTEISKMGHVVITPFDVCPKKDMPYSYYMGKDIMALLECDAILMMPGWSASKGCMAEFEVAKIYNKELLFFNELKESCLKI